MPGSENLWKRPLRLRVGIGPIIRLDGLRWNTRCDNELREPAARRVRQKP